MKTIYSYQNYKIFLKDQLESRGGTRLDLAEKIQCQSGYLSRILNGDAQMSLEQAYLTCEFLELGEEERRYFLLLVEAARAGVQGLKAFFSRQIKAEQQRHLTQKRLPKGKKAISEKDHEIYYSSWHYAAIHVAVGLSECSSKEGLAKRLRLPLKRVGEVVDFLVSIDVLKMDKGHYKRGVAHLHLGTDSGVINRHHTHWRVKAIESLDHRQEDDFHYAKVFTISKRELTKIKEQLVATLESSHEIIANDSDDEAVCSLILDLFHL